MMQLQDTDLLKDIPGYQAILKAVLKSQIQLLVEQLSDATGEESIILTASVNDGTLCHLGSLSGKDFLEGREEIKSQFLRHCLKKRHKLQTSDDAETTRPLKERRTTPQQSPHPTPISHPVQNRPPMHTVQTPGDQKIPSQSQYQEEITHGGQSPRNLPPNRTLKNRMKRTFVKTTPMSGGSMTITQRSDYNNVKQEPMGGDTTVSMATFGDHVSQKGDFSVDTTEHAPSQLTNAHLSMQSDGDQNIDSNVSSQSAGSNFGDDSMAGAIVKQETDDDDLEITSIEPGMSAEVDQMGYQGDWTPDMGYGPGSLGGDGQMGMEELNAVNQSQAGYMLAGPGSSSQTDQPYIEYSTSQDYKYDPSELQQFTDKSSSNREKKFHCDLCDKSFFHNGHLKRHMAGHMGVRFECRLCGKSFSQQHHRKVHELMTHKIRLDKK